MDTVKIARELEAIAQTGLHFAKDKFDAERYGRLREIAAEMLASRSSVKAKDILSWEIIQTKQ